MTGYIVRRLVGLMPALLLLIFTVVFMMSLLPGDTIDLMLTERTGQQSPDARAALERKLGLDQPFPVRYLRYIGNIMRGDFGESLWSQIPVTNLIVNRLPPTVEIGVLTIVLGSIVGVWLGVVAAVRHNGRTDYAFRLIATIGNSVPNFAIATGMVVLPALWWGVSANMRYVTFFEAPIDHLKTIAPPVLLLTLGDATGMLRLVRTQMLEVLRQDYIRTARAKGLANSAVIRRHALKNALIPVVTVRGLQIATLLSGSVITETVFAIPGVGLLLTSSIATRDYPVMQGIVVMVGVFVMLTNLVIDLSYGWLDPRITFS